MRQPTVEEIRAACKRRTEKEQAAQRAYHEAVDAFLRPHEEARTAAYRRAEDECSAELYREPAS